jgi:hypothetical protein
VFNEQPETEVMWSKQIHVTNALWIIETPRILRSTLVSRHSGLRTRPL